MDKIKVAVVDSGIDNTNKFLKNSICYGYGLKMVDGKVRYEKDFDDLFGHGTACSSSILKYCSDVEFIIVKIMNEQGRTNLFLVEEALRSLIDVKVNVINLSFSFSKIIDTNIYKLCNKLFNQNKILVASLANDGNESYPAFFDNVVGVRGANLESNKAIWFNRNYHIQCVVDNTPFMSCGLGNTYQMKKQNNSLATAKVTGIICDIISKNKSEVSYEQICEKLGKYALRNEWDDYSINNNKRVINKSNWYFDNKDSLLNRVYELSKKKVKINTNDNNNICDFILLSEKDGLPISTAYNFVKYISESLNIDVNYMELYMHDLLTLGSLTKYLYNYLK